MKHSEPEWGQHYLKVVDCQYACPAHTDVPGYIRLIAEGRYTEAYWLNRRSNVFPGILGRVCDRPCEPACRRGRIDGEEPVAICRLKRVAADLKEDIAQAFQPVAHQKKEKVCLIGGGPASLTVANDLLPLGYQVTLLEQDEALGGAMRRQVPGFRLPAEVLEEEIGYILSMGLQVQTGRRVDKLSSLLADFDAVFVGTGAPLGRDLDLPQRQEAGDRVQIGLEFLAQVSFGHKQSIGRNVIVIGGGNTAMDCCRTALRLGAERVSVVAPEAFDLMLASEWEKTDALEEGVVFENNLLPQAFEVKEGKLVGVRFQPLIRLYNEAGQWEPLFAQKPSQVLPADEVILAIGQRPFCPFIDAESKVAMTKEGLPLVDETRYQSQSAPKVFFGGDCLFGPKNIITAVAQGHQAARAIHDFLQNRRCDHTPSYELKSTKMGLHEWSYPNFYHEQNRQKVPHLDLTTRFKSLKSEVELGFDPAKALQEAERCLNCDVQTVFDAPSCIECDACIDVCPTECLTLTTAGSLAEVEPKLKAPRLEPNQVMMLSEPLATGRMMVKDENFCLHCGLCAERCPTAAWDMQKFEYQPSYASDPKEVQS